MGDERREILGCCMHDLRLSVQIDGRSSDVYVYVCTHGRFVG